LYKIKKGKEITYVYSEEEKAKKFGTETPVEESNESDEDEGSEEIVIKDAKGKEIVKAEKMHVQRYKGLGEMNAEELWETTMDPERRILKKVNITDAQDADKVFDMLMGTDVPARKSFIQSNARLANLDI